MSYLKGTQRHGVPNAIAANTTRSTAGRAAFSDYNDGHAVHSSRRAVIGGVTTLSELGAIRNLSSPATGQFGIRMIEVDSFGRGAGGIKGGRSGGGGGKTPPGPERPSRTTGIEQSRANRIGKGSKTGYTPPTVNYGEPKEQPSKEQPPSKESPPSKETPSKGSSSSGGGSSGYGGSRAGGSGGGGGGGGGSAGGGAATPAPDEMLPELELPTPVETQPAKKKFPWLLAGGGALALWLVFGDKEGKTT